MLCALNGASVGARYAGGCLGFRVSLLVVKGLLMRRRSERAQREDCVM